MEAIIAKALALHLHSPLIGWTKCMGAQLKHNTWSPHQGEHSDFFMNTFEATRGTASLHTTSYEVVVPRPTQSSREEIPSRGEGAPSDIATQSGREGIKGGKKRCKQHLQGSTTTTDHDNGSDGEAVSFGVRRSSITTRSDKRRARPPTDHFKRLLEEACPNHAYPIRHKLKDCGMMRSFMTSRLLTWGAELNEGSNGSDTTPFPRENVILTVYRGRPPLGRRRVSNLSPRALTHYGWGHRGLGV
jgi:hypothetical protein